MKTYGYRIAAPHRSRTVAPARVHAIEAPVWLLWLFGTVLLASMLALITVSIGHAQTLPATAIPSLRTADYVRQSATHDLFAIDAGRLALRRSHDPAIRAFAQQMIEDHSRSSDRLRQALEIGHVDASLPASLARSDRQAIRQLRTESREKFDTAYLQSQVLPARNALDWHRAYAQAGENTALKQFAHEASPTVERHLVRLEVLAQESFADRMCQAPAGAAPVGRTAAAGTAAALSPLPL